MALAHIGRLAWLAINAGKPTGLVADRHEYQISAELDRWRPIILAELAWQMGAGYKG